MTTTRPVAAPEPMLTPALPWECEHPRHALSRRTGRGTFDYDYEVCAKCASDRLLSMEDGEDDGEWSPVLSPEDVPAAHLAAAGLGDAREDVVDGYLRSRYRAWKREAGK